MSEEKPKLNGPDFARGVAVSRLADGAFLQGHVGDEPALLVRVAGEVFAIGAYCTHYGAPLDQGLLVDDTVRCPWHHACFSLRTGEALRPPARDPVSRWRVEEVGEPPPDLKAGELWTSKYYAREKLEPAAPRADQSQAPAIPESVIIIGGGVAGNAAAETLRREGFVGRITMLSADTSAPADRPNLSKDYLAGAKDAESNYLRPAKFYREHAIDLRLNALVTAIDTERQQVKLADGTRHSYDAVLLATGAKPIKLDVPGADLPHVHYLRTLADSESLVSAVKATRRAVVIGTSFIGLEVTASLRARDIEVDIVGTDAIPMAKLLGPELGHFFQKLHEDHGVKFHLGTTAAKIGQDQVTLKNGEILPADVVVVGIGVEPVTSLAEQSGIKIEHGVLVNEYLETSIPQIYAAGDIARWPDRLTGKHIRVEHFVVAERQGQTAARNMLGQLEVFDAVPFFWTQQYDVGISYVGHAEDWDEAQIDGSLAKQDCMITYRRDGRKLAVVTMNRDLDGLRAELELENAPFRPVRGR